MSAPAQRVSIIVPTRNNRDTIEECLASCREQRGARVELIVVDNHSTDGTTQFARTIADRVRTAGPERSAQRNIGVRMAASPVVLIVDSDMILDRHVARNALDEFAQHPSTGALVIPERSRTATRRGMARDLEKRCYLGDATVEAARVFRRQAYLDVGGFDEALWGGEDWDLTDRFVAAGWGIGRTAAAVVHAPRELPLRQLFAKKRYYGRALQRQRTAARSAGRAPRPLGRNALLREWRLLATDPLAAAHLAAVKVTEAAGIFFGMRDERTANKALVTAAHVGVQQ